MWLRERVIEQPNPAATQPGAAQPAAARSTTAQPAGAQLRVERARLRDWVDRLAVPRHIFVHRRNNARIGQMLASAFERYGLAVQLQGRYRNVVALPRRPTGPLTLIAAHYDSVPHCPGADDNASALAVMLECARLLTSAAQELPPGGGMADSRANIGMADSRANIGRADSRANIGMADSRANIGFIAFNAEEDGLLGSRDFVLRGLDALPQPIRMVHVLEMVGYRDGSTQPQSLPLPWVPERYKIGDYIGLIARGRSNRVIDRALCSTAAPGLRLVTAKTWGPLHRLLPDLSRSDHFPFWDKGHAAVMWTDTANFRNPHYHQKSDTPDTLDYAFMREVTELLCAIVSEPQ